MNLLHEYNHYLSNVSLMVQRKTKAPRPCRSTGDQRKEYQNNVLESAFFQRAKYLLNKSSLFTMRIVRLGDGGTCLN